VACAGDARLDYQRDEIESIEFTKLYNVVRIDHSVGSTANFGGMGNNFGLTIRVNDQVVFFSQVESTNSAPVISALKCIGEKPRLPGSRVILCIDNMPHSGCTALNTQLIAACRAEACTQDLFHVVKKMCEGISNTHELYTSGQVCAEKLAPLI